MLNNSKYASQIFGLIFSVLIFLIPTDSFSQFYPEDIPAMQRIIKNKIKLEYIYKNDTLKFENHYAPNGRKIGFKKYDDNGKIAEKYTWEMDTLGRRVRGNYYVGDSLVRKHLFIYDLKGRCVEALKSELTEGLLERAYHYTYDKLGLMTEEVHRLLDGSVDTRITYKYNHISKVSEKTIFKGNKTTGKKITISYDALGHPVESILYNDVGALTIKYTATYDGKGNITKAESYQFDPNYIRDAQGEIESGMKIQGDHIIYNTYIAKYDQANNLVETRDLDLKGKLKVLTRFKYETY